MINVILTLLAIALVLYLFLKWATNNHDVFEKQGIKYIKPLPLIGNSGWMFKRVGIPERILEIYRKFPDEKIVGLFEFVIPLYFIRSPELAKQLTIKDFLYFQDHKNTIDASCDELFGNVLMSTKGKQWRDMRSSLSPIFTGSKMRTMLELIKATVNQLADYIQEDYKKNGVKSYKLKDIFFKYTSDVIASCGFGVECDSLKNPENELYKIGKEIQLIQKPTILMKIIFMRYFPKITKYLGIKILGEKTSQIFNRLIINTMDVRKREGIVRPDMLQFLMKLREGQLIKTNDNEDEEFNNESKILNADTKHIWTDNELIAQSFIFYLAGADASSSVMAFIGYELAINPDIQSRLIEEIDDMYENLNGNPSTYEDLMKMKYLDMVVSEGLRKWPVGLGLDRECAKDYTYEDEDGLKFTIEKGSVLWIPVYGYHRDPKYYPNPETFDPERFSDENKTKRNIDAYVPFGIGPRNCIGLRFALMNIKLLLYYLLLNFRLKVCEDTQVPLKLKKSALVLVPERDIELNIEPRSDKIQIR